MSQAASANAALVAGQSLVEKGRLDAGLALQTVAIEAYQDNRDLHFTRMQIAMLAGNAHLALSDALTLVQLGDDNPLIYLTILAGLAREERWQDINRLEPIDLDEPVFNFITQAMWTIATLDYGPTDRALERVEQTFGIQGFEDRQQYLLGLASLTLNQPQRATNHLGYALSTMGLGAQRAALWTHRAATLAGNAELTDDLLIGINRSAQQQYQRYDLMQIEVHQDARAPTKRELMVEMFLQLAWFFVNGDDNTTAEILTDLAAIIDRGDQQVSAQLAVLRSNLATASDRPAIALSLWDMVSRELKDTPLWIDEQIRLLALLDRPDDMLAALNLAQAGHVITEQDVPARLLALRGRTLLQQQQYQDAVTIFAAWEELKRGQFIVADWQTYFAWASALFWLERPDAMEPIIEKAIALDPNNPFATNFLAYTWVDQGRQLPEALAMLISAAEQQPNRASITDSVGWAYFKMAQYDQALEYLERAWSLESNSWEIADHLGDVYQALDRRREAVWFWRRALAFDNLPTGQAAKIRTKLNQE